MNTISGLSFYDSLNKMTIGALVLLLIDRSSEDIEYGAVSMFLFIVTAFIVGCFFQTIVQIITGDTVLKKSQKNRLEKNDIDLKKSNNHFYKTQYKLIKSLFFRASIWIQWTNNPKLIQEAHNDVYKYSANSFEINRRYLKAYYNVARNGVLMNIPILEALENFMRNLIFYFLLLIIFPCENVDKYVFGVILKIKYCRFVFLIFAFGTWWLRREIQYKIHYLIWEGDSYIRKLDKECNKA